MREGLNSSFVENFRYTISGNVKLTAKDEIDVKHGKRVVFVEFIKTYLDAHVAFGAISRFLVHNCDILFKYHKDTTIFRFRFTYGHKKKHRRSDACGKVTEWLLLQNLLL